MLSKPRIEKYNNQHNIAQEYCNKPYILCHRNALSQCMLDYSESKGIKLEINMLKQSLEMLDSLSVC